MQLYLTAPEAKLGAFISLAVKWELQPGEEEGQDRNGCGGYLKRG
jgi:hypothetical protein